MSEKKHKNIGPIRERAKLNESAHFYYYPNNNTDKQTNKQTSSESSEI